MTKLRFLPGLKASWVAGDATHDAWHNAIKGAVKCHKKKINNGHLRGNISRKLSDFGVGGTKFNCH